MKKTITLFIFLLTLCFFCTSSFSQGIDCGTCDPLSPTFTLEVVPSVAMSGGNVVSGRFDISVRNNTAAPLELVNMEISVGINSASLSSLVSITSDAAQFPNVGLPVPPNFELIVDSYSSQMTSLNGQNYDQYYEYDHVVGGSNPPQVIGAGMTELIASTFIVFNGTQAFTAADLCNPSFLSFFPGNCIAVDPNVNNQFGFTNPITLVNCYTVECIPPSNPLPLELTEFSGEIFDRHNELYWTTATEINTLWHHIERSPSPGDIPFEMIGKVAAAGFSELPTDYSFSDDNPLRIGYYRIRTESLDGTLEYSDVVFLKRNDAAGILSVFPNPTPDRLYIQISLEGTSVLQFDIIDVLGRIMTSSSRQVDEGLATLEFDLSAFANGMYYIRMSDGFVNSIVPVIKNQP